MKKTISAVGERLNISPGTIRGWERRGLIKSERDWAGRRLFDEQIINRIKEIMDRPGKDFSGV